MVKCPFCAEHGMMSHSVILAVSNAIHFFLSETVEADQYSEEVQAELLNLANGLRGHLEREAEPKETYKPPACPTPGKRKYSNERHTQFDANAWKQHAYECTCGYWHLSKQAPAEHAAKVNAPSAAADEFPDLTLEDFLK